MKTIFLVPLACMIAIPAFASNSRLICLGTDSSSYSVVFENNFHGKLNALVQRPGADHWIALPCEEESEPGDSRDQQTFCTNPATDPAFSATLKSGALGAEFGFYVEIRAGKDPESEPVATLDCIDPSKPRR